MTGGCAAADGGGFGVFAAGEEAVFAGFFSDGLGRGFTTTEERHDCGSICIYKWCSVCICGSWCKW